MRNKEDKSRRSNKPALRLPWRCILVPIDFSETSFCAFEVAVPLARDLGARLLLLSVVESTVSLGGMEAVAVAIPDGELVEDAKARLPKIAKRFVPPSVKVDVLVEQGSAFNVITRVAKQQAVDLIVLTTHGRTGFERVLIGSTAERVVRHAHCPVYVVRSQRRKIQTRQPLSS